MGSSFSKSPHATNDYELAIKSSKELEWILGEEFGATGKGLHEKISSTNTIILQASHLEMPSSLVRNMRYLATIRNKLVHERGFDAIPDRNTFIQKFESSQEELKKLIVLHRNRNNKGATVAGDCMVM